MKSLRIYSRLSSARSWMQPVGSLPPTVAPRGRRCDATVQFSTAQTAPESDDEVQPFDTQSVCSNQLRRKLVAPSSHESPSFMHDPVAMKFVNCMMWDGKKSVSQKILKKTLEVVKTTQLSKVRANPESDVVTDPLKVFHQAIDNCKPIMGTTGVRRGGKLYHVPYPLPLRRQLFLAIKWMIHTARDRKGKDMHIKLAAEILDAHNNQGAVIKKKQDLHRLAEANRAFAHFRW